MLTKRETPKESISDIYKTQKMTEFMQTAEELQLHAHREILSEKIKHPMIFPRSRPSAQIVFKSATATEFEKRYRLEEVDLWKEKKQVLIVQDKDKKLRAFSKKTNKPVPIPRALRKFLEEEVDLPNIRRKGLENIAWIASDTQEKVWEEGFVGKQPFRILRRQIPLEEVEEDRDKQ